MTYINVAPDPVGVGQSVTVDFWLAVPLADRRTRREHDGSCHGT